MTNKQIKELVREFERFLLAKERRRKAKASKRATGWRRGKAGHCDLCTCVGDRWVRAAAPSDVRLCNLCIKELNQYGGPFLEIIEAQLAQGDISEAQNLVLAMRKDQHKA